jgi:Uma2 family endonuclease
MLDRRPNIVLDIDNLITEDDTPVDNLPSEKQQRLLTEPLYSSWAGPGDNRPFLAAANVGVFSETGVPAIVPDMFLSLDVTVARDWWRKEHRSYFIGEFGKPPELVLEIVSNTVGNEDTEKRQKYAWMRVSFYVIYDPRLQVMDQVLTIYRLEELQYERQDSARFARLKLGLTLWQGEFEGREDTWLRWTDGQGVLIPTGKERAEQADQQAAHERQRAEQADQQAAHERQRAEQADQRAEQERQRAERLTALLRQAGIDPEQREG